MICQLSIRTPPCSFDPQATPPQPSHVCICVNVSFSLAEPKTQHPPSQQHQTTKHGKAPSFNATLRAPLSTKPPLKIPGTKTAIPSVAHVGQMAELLQADVVYSIAAYDAEPLAFHQNTSPLDTAIQAFWFSFDPSFGAACYLHRPTILLTWGKRHVASQKPLPLPTKPLDTFAQCARLVAVIRCQQLEGALKPSKEIRNVRKWARNLG